MKWKMLAAALMQTFVVSVALAQTPDPAIETVAAFDDALLASMHHDATRLGGAVAADFNVEVMASFIVGPAWATMAAAERDAVTGALQQYLVARFADQFDSFNGERFEVDPAAQSRGLDKLVRTQVVASGGSPTHIDYRLRAYDGRWRIIDIYLNGVSQLTTEHADLAADAERGASALLARLNAATQALQ